MKEEITMRMKEETSITNPTDDRILQVEDGILQKLIRELLKKYWYSLYYAGEIHFHCIRKNFIMHLI